MDTRTEWGVLVTLPNGDTDVEKCTNRGHALCAESNMQRAMPTAAVKLVYRTVKVGGWTTDHSGGGDRDWGIRRTWSDGQTEIDPTGTRHDAETFARITRGACAEVVSRPVLAGDWWLAEVPA